jgi:hypothetical protein
MDSFQMVQSQNISSLAESFIDIEFDTDGKAVSVGDSTFLPMGENMTEVDFIKEATISKILKYVSLFSEHIKNISQETSMRSQKMENVRKWKKARREKFKELHPNIEEFEDNHYEEDMDEFDIDEMKESLVSQSLIDSLLSLIISENLTELFWLFCNKLG